MRKVIRRILQFNVYLGSVNFAVFWVAAVYLGGDALSGHAFDGRYYLSSHGHLTEVSRAVFTYSKWHTYSVFLTHPLAILSVILLSRQPQNPD
ncbi:MAG TPA: hypothetical protein VJX70_14310 [Candidatus Acidoferrum sp.]|nr:hypothetical protein [Candidatus Acidoferrum sp.]